MIKLTVRQTQVLKLIKEAIEETGFPPTRAEIAAKLGFSSANAAEEHLRALNKKGVITIKAGTSRGIKILLDPFFSDDENQSLSFPSKNITPKFLSKFKPSSLSKYIESSFSLPLIGRVAAGSPLFASEQFERHFQCDPSMFAEKPDYLLKVKGLSMRDAGILDGDLVAVKRQSDVCDGSIIVARIDDEVTVKRFKQTAEKIELIPANPNFSTIIVSKGKSDFHIEGLIVGLIRTAQF